MNWKRFLSRPLVENVLERVLDSGSRVISVLGILRGATISSYRTTICLLPVEFQHATRLLRARSHRCIQHHEWASLTNEHSLPRPTVTQNGTTNAHHHVR